MKYLYDEISYIRGLVDGLEINKDTKEGKVINKIIDVLERSTLRRKFGYSMSKLWRSNYIRVNIITYLGDNIFLQ